MSAGVTIAFAGLVGGLFGQPVVFPDGGPVEPGRRRARRALPDLARRAADGRRARGRRRCARGRASWSPSAPPASRCSLFASLSATPFGDLAAADGSYHAGLRTLVGIIALGQLAVAAAWWHQAAGAPTWGEVCVIALMALSGLDALAYLFASEPYPGAWWASLTLRAGQFAVPAVGLVIGFIAVADRLRELQDELGRGLEVERERARREEELAGLDRRRREQERERIARLIEGDGLGVALQPIVDLDSRQRGRRRGAGPVHRRGRRAHADRGDVPRRPLARARRRARAGVIERALRSHRRLPDGLYLALNVSPAVLGRDELE